MLSGRRSDEQRNGRGVLVASKALGGSVRARMRGVVSAVVAVAFVAALVVLRGPVAIAAPETEVTFADANLKACVAAKLGQSPLLPITEENLALLTELDCHNKSIVDLAPLVHATNLAKLNLESNPASDLSPLAGLTNLQYLMLNTNKVSNLAPLAGLTNLQELYLASNLISDVSQLAGLSNLKVLHLHFNQIPDVQALAGLTNLTELNLAANQLADVSPLAGLTNLTTLNLYKNQVSDVTPLSGLTKLNYLDLTSNRVADVSPLAGLSKMITAWLTDQQIAASAAVAVPYPSPVKNHAGALVPLAVVSGSGATAGTNITWYAKGSGVASWAVPVKLGTYNGTFEGKVNYSITGAVPKISGVPGDGVVGEPYSFAFTVTGDPAPAVALEAGSLPPGLSMDGAGVVSGTPTQIGVFTFTVTATNESGVAKLVDVKITVKGAPAQAVGEKIIAEVVTGAGSLPSADPSNWEITATAGGATQVISGGTAGVFERGVTYTIAERPRVSPAPDAAAAYYAQKGRPVCTDGDGDPLPEGVFDEAASTVLLGEMTEFYGSVKCSVTNQTSQVSFVTKRDGGMTAAPPAGWTLAATNATPAFTLALEEGAAHVEALPSNYTLAATVPAGFKMVAIERLDPADPACAGAANAPAAAAESCWVPVTGATSVAQGEHAVFRVSAQPVELPGLPMTGGLGSDLFTIGGAGLLGLAGVVYCWRRLSPSARPRSGAVLAAEGAMPDGR